MDWAKLVKMHAEVDTGDIVSLIPKRLACGTLTYQKALEMMHPPLFIAAVFAYCSAKVTDLDAILAMSGRLIRGIPFGHHPEFMMRLDEENIEVQRQFLMLRYGCLST